MILIIRDIIRAIITIEFLLVPTHIIISGPRATFGRELIIVKYGSIILASVLFHQRIVAINIPKADAIKKLINVSYVVTPM